jgi:pimeloyl-ACP methyl ester carboxylesterase
MTSAPIILVPGFWLGAWAWDEVAAALRADGHDVTAITLPGLESADADRSGITFADHVNAIIRAVEAAGSPVVLAVHSASGFSGYAASDRVPERIAAMIYVDTAPGIGPLDPDFTGVEKPMVWEEIEAEENLDGLSAEQKAAFRERAVPVPGGVLRESYELTNDARRDIPSTLICTGFTAEQYQTYAREHPAPAFLAGIPELRNATWIDLPTSHWPMWSRPDELAAIIGDVAHAHPGGAR